MGLKIAVANGNWSNPATWNAGTLPQIGDVVASNNFTVTIDQNVNVSVLTNTAQAVVSAVPGMTSNTTPSGIASASGEWNTSNQAWRAFDGSLSNGWLSNSLVSWLAYEFVTPQIISQYIVLGGGITAAPRDWTFEAWNGTSWVVLHTVTGNTNTTTYTGSFTNTTAYSRYRINITANNGQASYSGITELQLIAAGDSTVAAVAGGGFILNSGYILNLTSLTSGVISGPSVCLTYSASSGISTINGNIFGSNNTDFQAINYTGAANLVINGNLASGSRYWGMTKSGTGTLTIIGNVFVTSGNNNNRGLSNTGTGTINITGNVAGQYGGVGHGFGIFNTAVCTINITGNVSAGDASNISAGITNSAAAYMYITGNVYSNLNNSGITSSAAHFLSIVGTVSSNFQNPISNNSVSVLSTNASAINLFSGPFISSSYGFVPFQCIRMHLIPSVTSYFEFRDETTNGAVSPGAIAPSTRLVSPASVSDGPTIANVRFGTTYALGTLTGTLRMPHPNQVTFGIAVDNTFGNAVLTAASVWDYLVSNITVENSIGMRLKNVSTPQTTGEQLEAFLRLE